MDYSVYRKMLEARSEINSAEKKRLLKIYLERPSLPQLQSIRTSLAELKSELNQSDTPSRKRMRKMRHLLNKRRPASSKKDEGSTD